MSSRDVDRLLVTWLAADAPMREPDHLLEAVLARTSRTRRRPGWRLPERWLSVQLALRWRRTPALIPILLVVLLLASAVAAALIASQRPVPVRYDLASDGRIAYVSDRQFWTARPDGSDARSVAAVGSTESRPALSPDGHRLAVRQPATAADRWDLVVIDLDTGRTTTLVRDAEVLSRAAWSPDGLRLAYSRWISYPGQRDRVFTIPADASAQPVQVGDPDLSAFDPVFSPDGTRILFQSDTCQPTSCADSSHSFALHVMRADGTDVREVTTGPVYFEPSVDPTGRFGWSADGSQVVFIGGGTGPAITYLYVATLASGEIVQVSDGELVWAASWSPFGDRIAYVVGERSLSRKLATVAPDGSGSVTLATANVGTDAPIWSPTGLAVGINVDRLVRVFLVDSGRELTTTPLSSGEVEPPQILAWRLATP